MKAYKNYKNNTDIEQTIFDGNGNPITVQPGKSVRIMTCTDTDAVKANERRKKALNQKEK